MGLSARLVTGVRRFNKKIICYSNCAEDFVERLLMIFHSRNTAASNRVTGKACINIVLGLLYDNIYKRPCDVAHQPTTQFRFGKRGRARMLYLYLVDIFHNTVVCYFIN